MGIMRRVVDANRVADRVEMDAMVIRTWRAPAAVSTRSELQCSVASVIYVVDSASV